MGSAVRTIIAAGFSRSTPLIVAFLALILKTRRLGVVPIEELGCKGFWYTTIVANSLIRHKILLAPG